MPSQYTHTPDPIMAGSDSQRQRAMPGMSIECSSSGSEYCFKDSGPNTTFRSRRGPGNYFQLSQIWLTKALIDKSCCHSRGGTK